MSRRTSIELEQEITEQFKFGHNVAYLSNYYQIPSLRIRHILKRNGVKSIPHNMLDITFDDEKRMCELYQKGFSTLDIAQHYFNNKIKCDHTVAMYLRKNGIELRNFGNENKVFNDTFFEVIDSEEKAYYIGFIYADGNIRIGKNNAHLLQIELQESNGYILEKLVELLQYKSKIKDYENEIIHYVPKELNYFVRKNRFENYSKLYYGCSLQIPNTKVYEDLIAQGITENKTYNITLPNKISKELMRHFIRGYFDGNGSCSIHKITFYGQHNILQFIKDNMKELSLNNNKIFDKKKEKMSMLSYGAKRDLKVLYDYFYTDSTVYLKRKKSKLAIYVGIEVTE